MKFYKKDLAILSAVAAKESIHHSLILVRVEPGRMVATDGKMLSVREIRTEDEEKPFEPFLLEPKALKTLAGNGAFLDAGGNGTVKIRSANQKRDPRGRFTKELVDCGWETVMKKPSPGLYSYPAYDKVIPPEADAVIRVKVDPQLLLRMMKTFDGVSSVTMGIRDGERAIRFDGKTDDGRKVLGVIMPLCER